MPRSHVVEKLMEDMIRQTGSSYANNLAANSAISWEFLERHKEKLGIGQGQIMSGSNENIPVEYFLKYQEQLGQKDFEDLCTNKNVPQWFIARIVLRMISIPVSFFAQGRFSYDFVKCVADLIQKPKYLLLHPNTPADVVDELSADEENIAYVVCGPFVQKKHLDRYTRDAITHIATSQPGDPTLTDMLNQLLKNPAIPISFFTDNFDIFYFGFVLPTISFFSDPRVTVEFIEKVRPRLASKDELVILTNPNVPISLVEEMREKSGASRDFFVYLFYNLSFSWEFFEDRIEEIKRALDDTSTGGRFGKYDLLQAIGMNPNLPVSFFINHPECLSVYVSSNKFTKQFQLEKKKRR